MKIACLKSPTGIAQSLSPQNRLRMLSPSRSFGKDHQNGLSGAALCWLDPYKLQSDIVGCPTRLTRTERSPFIIEIPALSQHSLVLESKSNIQIGTQQAA